MSAHFERDGDARRMMSDHLSHTGLRIFYVVFILQIFIAAVLFLNDSPVFDLFSQFLDEWSHSHRRRVKLAIAVLLVVFIGIAAVPSFAYDLITGQGKFER